MLLIWPYYYMAWIYLIGQRENNGMYKIGMTKANDISNRLKQLQTGNSEELVLIDSYKTETPFKLESSLHRHYSNKNVLNEWFMLSNEDISKFKNTCDFHQNIIDSLKENPFFKRS